MKKSILIRRNLTRGEKNELGLFCDSLLEGFAATDNIELARELSVISWQSKLKKAYAPKDVETSQEETNEKSDFQ